MLSIAEGPQSLFSFERFRFHLRVASLLVLPPYKGAVFRGAFGNAFRKTVCAGHKAGHKKECRDCLLQRRCLFVTVFQPSPPPGHPDAGKYDQIPPPYVLNPPSANRQVFHPDESLDFELVLLGPAEQALPYFIHAFMNMGSRGLGSERGRFDIERVDLLRRDGAFPIYDGPARTLGDYPAKERMVEDTGDTPVNSAILHLLTPLRLKEQGDLVTRFTFPIFFERLLHRLFLLHSFYGTSAPFPNTSPLLQEARNITVTADKLHWYDWERYSGRQKSSMKLGGLRGVVELKGNLGPFMPYLRLGEILNTGQGTTFGLGRFSITFIR